MEKKHTRPRRNEYTRPRRNEKFTLLCVCGGYAEAMALQTQQVVCLVNIMFTRPRRNNTQTTIVYVFTRYTNCRIWRVVSSFSNLNRWSSAWNIHLRHDSYPDLAKYLKTKVSALMCLPVQDGQVYLQCVAACCSVLQCVAVCCSVLQYVAVCCSVLQSSFLIASLARMTLGSIECSLPCCSVLQGVAVCCSVLQCIVVCCSVLQCVAVCCSRHF